MNNQITMTLNVDHLLMQALQEDITSEDITTNSVMRAPQAGEVQLISNRTVSSPDFRFLKEFSSFWTIPSL